MHPVPDCNVRNVVAQSQRDSLRQRLQSAQSQPSAAETRVRVSELEAEVWDEMTYLLVLVCLVVSGVLVDGVC